MQLQMPFAEIKEPPPPAPTASGVSTSPPPMAWEKIDEGARIAALGVLARLIARVLAAKPGEAHHE